MWYGLASRPRKTSPVHFLSELLLFFGYSLVSGAALLNSTLPLRYCAVRFACKVPTWKLPAGGNVAGLVTEGGEEVRSVHVAPCARASRSIGALGSLFGGRGSGLSGRGKKRVRLSRKTPALDFSKSSGGSTSSSCLKEVEG